MDKLKHDKKKLLRKAFSERLITTMRERGFVSARNSEGVDRTALVQNTGCSSQMAHNYLTGANLPDPDSLEKIAAWLNVDEFWLLHGTKTNNLSTRIDRELLKEVLIQAKPILEAESNWNSALDNIFNIYESLAQFKGQNDEKNKTLKLMLNLLKKETIS